MATTNTKVLYRRPQQGKIAGVCAGLSDYFELDVSLVRVVFILAALATGGFAVIVYIALAIILPEFEEDGKVNQRSVGENMQRLSEEVKSNQSTEQLRNYLGVGVIAVGVWFALGQFFPVWTVVQWRYIWPILLIVVGVFILMKNRSSK